MPTSPKTFRPHSAPKHDDARGTKQQRGYGGEWERISLMFRAHHPVCQQCNDAPSEDVDHIIPFEGIKDPKRTDWRNLRALCRACHNRKTRGQGGKNVADA